MYDEGRIVTSSEDEDEDEAHVSAWREDVRSFERSAGIPAITRFEVATSGRIYGCGSGV
jgi:hypothetical protein